MEMDIWSRIFAEKLYIFRVCVRTGRGEGVSQMWTGVDSGEGRSKITKCEDILYGWLLIRL